MDKKIRIEITASGEIKAKTLGMDDEKCLDYVDVLENLLDAETVESTYTEEFLQAQVRLQQEEHVEQRTNIKGK